MKRLPGVLFVFVLLVLSSACGDIFVRGALTPGIESASGLVSIVQFSATSGQASVTLVTLVQSGMANTLSFCGDQRTRFPMDQFVRVNFTPGTLCASVILIVIG